LTAKHKKKTTKKILCLVSSIQCLKFKKNKDVQIMKTYLQPIFTNQKSFYNKAVVTIDTVLWSNNQELKATGEKHLYSYNTEICYIDKKNKVHLLPLWNYSTTTLKHLKEFLKQNGFTANSKKQIEKDYYN
jgi:hypothetical protein